MQVVRAGVQEIIGQAGIQEILETEVSQPCVESVSCEQAQSWLSAVRQQYGVQGGRGLAVRAGRAGFQYFLREYGAKTGLTDIDFRTLPVKQRLLAGMQRLVDAFNLWSNGNIQINESGGQWICSFDQTMPNPDQNLCCAAGHFLAGLLQEYLYWASGGRHYMLARVESCQSGDVHNCAVLINQQSLE